MTRGLPDRPDCSTRPICRCLSPIFAVTNRGDHNPGDSTHWIGAAAEILRADGHPPQWRKSGCYLSRVRGASGPMSQGKSQEVKPMRSANDGDGGDVSMPTSPLADEP